MTTLFNTLKSMSIDLVGLGFAGVAAFEIVTGHVNEPGFAVALAIASAYLGIKVPGPTP